MQKIVKIKLRQVNISCLFLKRELKDFLDIVTEAVIHPYDRPHDKGINIIDWNAILEEGKKYKEYKEIYRDATFFYIPDKTRYLHYDNLGSIDTITDGQGNIVERMAYTAFGERRKGDWRVSDLLLPIIPA
ncbi:hypothetical protein BSPWISOXPB_1888 [uncultured Gammaproteobacteria bacterium]|nr:hypothetical protein BSPWISOXPB_1888 [uncultured Gammaproteobacteria bacterium]